MTATSGDGTGSLEKALDILEIVGSAPAGLSQSNLAQRLQLPRATVYRLLATLVARRLLRRDPLRRVYCLGFKCFEMARQVWAMPDLVSAAAVELRGLRDLTGETTYLATLDGLEMVSLERVDGAHSQRSYAALGVRKPLHCTSQGKAMLAAMPGADQEVLVKALTLKPHTPLTITDRRRLMAELRITSTRGWSVDDEEIAMGVRCVGAAVIDRKGAVRGAISVAGPAWRMTRQRLELLGPEVMGAASRIGEQLAVRETVISDPNLEGEAIQAANGPWHSVAAVWPGMQALVRSFGQIRWPLPSEFATIVT
jgi:DNA-binding IclR family transcriptional regulator